MPVKKSRCCHVATGRVRVDVISHDLRLGPEDVVTLTPVELRRVLPDNSEHFDRWFDVLNRSDMSRPGPRGQGWHPDEWRARAGDVHGPKNWQLLSFEVDEGVVAVAALEVTRDDNLESFRADFHVDPRRCRRGHGTAAMDILKGYVAEMNRSTIVVTAIEGLGEVGVAPNRYFAPRLGFSVADEHIRREISWPRPQGELRRLELEWLPYASNYEILTWMASTPERWLAQRASLSAVMPVEAPHGDLDVEEEVWDEERVRSHEARADAMGRELIVSVARHIPSDRLVGFTELTVSREFQATAYQWDTLVLREHRGHRLGGLLKIANMRRLDELNFGVERISTFNSSGNGPMLKVNKDLGAVESGAMVYWKLGL